MIRNAIFAGGGARSFWQIGFWCGAREAGAALEDTVTYAGSVSAGCAMATAALLQREIEALELLKTLSAQNEKNLYWRNLFNPDPIFPHAAINRQAMETLLDSADLEKLRPFRLEFLMARYPRFLAGPLAAGFAFSVYGLEKKLMGRVHPQWTQKLGFTPLVASNQDATQISELMDMIMGSSCVPPVMPCPGYRGEPVLDGGVVDNVPAFLADDRDGDTLILLSKRYRGELPKIAGRVYVQPSETIVLDKFDYANPEGLQRVFDLGVKDAQNFQFETGKYK